MNSQKSETRSLLKRDQQGTGHIDNGQVKLDTWNIENCFPSEIFSYESTHNVIYRRSKNATGMSSGYHSATIFRSRPIQEHARENGYNGTLTKKYQKKKRLLIQEGHVHWQYCYKIRNRFDFNSLSFFS